MSIKQLLLSFIFILFFFTNGFSYRNSLRDSDSRTNVAPLNNEVDQTKKSYNRYRSKKDKAISSSPTNISPLTDRFLWQFSVKVTSLEIKEIVYIDDYVLSRLDWKFEEKIDLKAALTYRLSKRVNFYSSLAFSLPLKNGTMDDYDWAETDVATNYTQSGVLTHESHHINKLDYDFNLDFNFEYKVVNSKFYEFSPLLGWKLRFLKMSGYDGYANYPDGYHSFSGKVIDYSHLRSIVYLGIKNKFNFSERVSLSLKTLYSPVAYIKAVDNHFLRELIFSEYFLWGTYLYNEILLKIDLSQKYALTINLSHTYIPTYKGNSYVEEDGVTYSTGKGGTSVNDLSLGMGLTLKI